MWDTLQDANAKVKVAGLAHVYIETQMKSKNAFSVNGLKQD